MKKKAMFMGAALICSAFSAFAYNENELMLGTDGKIRYNTDISELEYSNDAGITWAAIGSGGGGNVTGSVVKVDGTALSTANFVDSSDINATASGSSVTMALTTTASNNIAKGVTAYGWGNHSAAGYLTDAPIDGTQYARKDGNWTTVSVVSVETDPIYTNSTAHGIGAGNITRWDSSLQNETDTLATVTARGNTTTVSITTGNVTAPYFLGNGSLLTGITVTDVDTLATVTTRGNATTSGVTLGAATPAAARLNVLGNGVSATNFTSFAPTAQQLSQTAVIEGNGSAWYAWKDVASGNEGAVGASVNGNGFLATTTSTPLELRTANTARITITSAGNVGIGTTAPDSLLSVIGKISAGSAKLGGESTVGQVWTASDTVGNGAWANATGGSGGSSQWTTTGNDIYYTTGNVGVGVTNPATALDVAGTVNATTVTAGNLPKYYTATRSYTSNSTTVGTDMLDLSFDVVAGKRYYVEVTIGASDPNTAGGFGASFHANTTNPAVSNSSFGQWLWNYDVGGGGRVYTQSWQPWTTCINGTVPGAQAFTATGRMLPQTFSGIFDVILNATIYPTFKTSSTSYTTTTSDASTLSVTEIN